MGQPHPCSERVRGKSWSIGPLNPSPSISKRLDRGRSAAGATDYHAGMAARDGSHQCGHVDGHDGGKTGAQREGGAPALRCHPPDPRARTGTRAWIAAGSDGYWACELDGAGAVASRWTWMPGACSRTSARRQGGRCGRGRRSCVNRQRFCRTTRCSLPAAGEPRQFQHSLRLQFWRIMSGSAFVLLGSENRNYRIIYSDGRARVKWRATMTILYYGVRWASGKGTPSLHSGFNEDFWFTNGGLPHTSAQADRALHAGSGHVDTTDG